MKEELVYLGFVIYMEGLKMDPKKVRVIDEWSTPVNIGEVRSFHGLAIFTGSSSKISMVFAHL